MLLRRPIILSIGLFWACNSPVSGQDPCDTARIHTLLRHSSEWLDQYQNQSGLEEALKAFELAGACNEQDSLQREAYLLADLGYRSLASELIQKGLFNQAIDLAQRDIALHQRVNQPVADYLSTAYQLLANAHNLNGNQQLSIDALRKGLQVRQTANPVDPKNSIFYDQLSNSYLALEDTVAVREVMLEWEAFYKKIGKKGGVQAPLGLAIQWSMYYEMIGQPAVGAQRLEDTLAVYAEKFKQRATFLGIAEFQLCELYAQMRQFRKSLQYSEKNVKALEERMSQQNGKLFTRSHYTWYLAQSARASWNLYLETGDSSFYHQAVARTEASENELRAMRDRRPEDGFRDWIANRVGIVANLMEVRYGLYRQTGDIRHAERSFESVEASKMFTVQEFLHETHALRWGGLPDSLSEKEEAYRQEVNDLESIYFMQRGKPGADSLLAANDRALFVSRDAYRLFLQDLEQKYPDYFRLKYRHPAVKLREVQTRMLESDECLLDLSMENDAVFLLLVRPDTVIWLSAPLTQSLEEAMELVSEGSRRFPDWQLLPERLFLTKMESYAAAAYQVYRALIEPVRAHIREKVLLVPRDGLAGFPFGALLTRPEKAFAKPFLWHYLDQELVLSEIYSAGLFAFLQERNSLHQTTGKVLALAPFDQEAALENLNLPAGDIAELTRVQVFSVLPATGAEVQTVAQLSQGKALLGAKATKKAFREMSSQYQILHLATHSVANEVLGEYSFVALQSDQNPRHLDLLFARDIYGMRISAELVVLSACETAMGQFRENEGMVGLTRAFQCAGARNVAASLWTVNDASTSTLMVYFHEEIRRGLPYAAALAQAKRRFIRTDRQHAHPYYWAGFVLQGR